MKTRASVELVACLAVACMVVGSFGLIAASAGGGSNSSVTPVRGTPVNPGKLQLAPTGMVMQTAKTSGTVTGFTIRCSCTSTQTVSVGPQTVYVDDTGKSLTVNDIKYESLISATYPSTAAAQGGPATTITKRTNPVTIGLVTSIAKVGGKVSGFTILGKSGSTSFNVGSTTFFYKLAQGTPGYATDIPVGMGVNVWFWDGTPSSGAFAVGNEKPLCYIGTVSSVTKNGTQVTGFAIPGRSVSVNASTAYIDWTGGQKLTSAGAVGVGNMIQAWYYSLSKPAVIIVLNPHLVPKPSTAPPQQAPQHTSQ